MSRKTQVRYIRSQMYLPKSCYKAQEDLDFMHEMDNETPPLIVETRYRAVRVAFKARLIQMKLIGKLPFKVAEITPERVRSFLYDSGTHIKISKNQWRQLFG